MTGPSYDRPKYPGIIPYRTNSPSSPAPAVLTDGPRLLNVAKRTSISNTTELYKDSYNTLPANTSEHHQFYLQHGNRRSMAAITSTSIYATEKRNGSKESLKKVYTEKDLRESLQNYTLTEDEVRDKYYAYWEQQRVRNHIISVSVTGFTFCKVLNFNIKRH